MKALTRIVVVLLSAVLAVSAATAAQQNPRAVIDGLHESLLAVMKNGTSLGLQGRYDRLAPGLDRAFSFATMIQVVASSGWKQASPAEQEQLVRAFTRMSVSTYATNFKSHSGEAFETVGEKPGPQDTVIVATRIRKSNGDAVDIEYLLKKIDADWRIIDVVLDRGISELALRKSEYRSLLKSGGVPALITALNAKADEMIAK